MNAIRLDLLDFKLILVLDDGWRACNLRTVDEPNIVLLVRLQLRRIEDGMDSRELWW
jgi:hypothetical protein